VIWTGGLATAFYDVILFPAERYSSIQGALFGAGASLLPQSYLLVYLFPTAALLLLLVCALNWPTCRRDRRLQLSAAFAIAGFVGCFPRPDIAHIAFAAPLALPLVLLCIGRLSRSWRPLVLYGALCMMLALAVPSARGFVWIVEVALEGTPIPTPRGWITAVKLPGFPELLRRLAATPSRDAYFFYPYMPMTPFLTARNDVSAYDVFMPEYTLPFQYQEACIAVMRRAYWIVVDRNWSDPQTLKSFFL
jgi:hypothetical protein